jgi:hypothetical protein
MKSAADQSRETGTPNPAAPSTSGTSAPSTSGTSSKKGEKRLTNWIPCLSGKKLFVEGNLLEQK